MLQRNYKDRLFKFIFGNEEYKEYALSLYNAVNGSEYETVEDLRFTTIDDVLFLGMKNDVSFIIDSRMNLYEQQSTFSPNMPVRGLMYFGRLYDSYISTNELNVYGSKLLKLPTPRFIIFYNGEKDINDIKELRFTSSLIHPEESAVEVIAQVININGNKGGEILSNCRPLREYSVFIERIKRKMYNGLTKDAAVLAAVDSCIKDHILEDILVKHKSEVLGMFLTEYDEEKAMGLFYKDGHEDGMEEGLRKGMIEGMREGMREGMDLIGYLLSAGRIDDAKRATEDEGFRKIIREEMSKVGYANEEVSSY